METLTLILLRLLALYLAAGFLFALVFCWRGVSRLDPHAQGGTWGFRLLIMPGSTLLWPLLARRWMRGQHGPPEEQNAHRRAAHRPT